MGLRESRTTEAYLRKSTMWRTIGHDRAVHTLERAMREGRLSHAYLLVGPARVGKMTLALDLARVANCVGEEMPCGDCRQCRRITDGLHPDVQVVGVYSQTAGETAGSRDHRNRPGERGPARREPQALRGKVPRVRHRWRGAPDRGGCQLPAQDPRGAAGAGGPGAAGDGCGRTAAHDRLKGVRPSSSDRCPRLCWSKSWCPITAPPRRRQRR